MTMLVEFSRIQETSDGDREFEAELIEMYLDDALIHMDRIAKSIEAGDATALRQSAHTLKGSSANIGAVGVQAEAFTLEKAGSAAELTAADRQLARLRSIFADTEKQFRGYLAEIT